MIMLELPVSLTDPDSRVPVMDDYAGRIPTEISSLLFWGSARSRYATVADDRASEFEDRGGGATTFAQATSGNRPAIGAVRVNGHEAASFDAARPDYASWSASHPTGNHWYACVFRVPALTGSIMGLLGINSSHKHWLSVEAATQQLRYSVGNTNTAQALSGEFALGSWVLAMASFQASSGTARIALNGGTPVTGVNASALSTNTGCVIGAGSTAGSSPLTGDIADWMIGDVDLLDGTHISEVNLIEQYVAATYGIAMVS